MKHFIRLAAVFLAAALMLGGCMSFIDPNPALPSQTTEDTQTGSRPHDPADTIEDIPEPEYELTVWSPTKAGDLEAAAATAREATPAALLALLADAGQVPKNTEAAVSSLSADGKTLTLDLSAGYASFLAGKTPADVMLSVGSVVNSFLALTGASAVRLTAGGKDIKSDGNLYAGELPFFDLTAKMPVNLASGKYVSITFDDGPHAEITRKIAEKLASKGARATFFVVGNRVSGKAAAGMQYAAICGSEIAIHGYTHTVKYSKCTDEEFEKELSLTDAVIRKYIPGEVTLMRPIGGSILKERIPKTPYTVVNWDVDSEDWMNKSHKTPEETEANIQTTVANVKAQVKNGSIILMHEIYDNSYEAFCRIIDWLYEEGYEVVTVSELLGERCVPGVRYYRA